MLHFLARRLLSPRAAAALLLALLTLPAAAAPDASTISKVPPPDVMVSRMWKVLRSSACELTGNLETSAGKSYPVVITARGSSQTYVFPKNDLQLSLTIGENGSTLKRRTSDADTWKPVSRAELTTAVFGSDITFGDLVMDFLNWDGTKVLGTDDIKTVPCYAYQVNVPAAEKTNFDSVRYWVASEHSAIIRADALNGKGEVVRRIEVNGITKIGKTPVMKEMMISTLMPGRDISSSRSWIKIQQSRLLE